MRVLFLDDQPERHRAAHVFVAQVLPSGGPHDIVHVDTAAGAIAAMEAERFDVVFLDHDLSIVDQMQDPTALVDDNNGTYVVRWMVHEMKLRPRSVVVHSFNGPAGERMVSTLVDHGIDAVRSIFRAHRAPPWEDDDV